MTLASILEHQPVITIQDTELVPTDEDCKKTTVEQQPQQQPQQQQVLQAIDSNCKTNDANEKLVHVCILADCTNLVQLSGSKCNQHCRRKRCSRVGCSKYANKSGYCKIHMINSSPNANYNPTSVTIGRRCRHIDGCSRYAQAAGFCVSHGGGKQCQHENCTKNAQAGGLCRTHGGGKKCHRDGCSKYAHRGGLCVAHGGGKRCGFADCTKTAQTGGFCVCHGGGKRCNYNDCSRLVFRLGLCRYHGSKTCTYKDCKQVAHKNGLCSTHANSNSETETKNLIESPNLKQQVQENGLPREPLVSAYENYTPKFFCLISGCLRYAKCNGNCLYHAARCRMNMNYICI